LDEDFKLVSILINTADYCFTTISQLEEKMIEKLNEEYKGQVQLSDEREAFVKYRSNFLTKSVLPVRL
jgi:hypothetical protein